MVCPTGACSGGANYSIKKPAGFFDAKGKPLRAPEILLEFPGGTLTESVDSATSLRTGGTIPYPAHMPPGTIETLRGLC